MKPRATASAAETAFVAARGRVDHGAPNPRRSRIDGGPTLRPLILIPAFDEAATLPAVVSELRRHQPGCELLVVDDASVDGSGELVPELGVRWLQLGQHLGLGGAVRAGLRYSRLLGFEVVVRVDADGQHDGEQIALLLEPIANGRADATVGSRFHAPGGQRPTGHRRLAHRAIAACLSRLTGQPVSDPTSGFWAFGPAAVRLLADHHPRGFSEPELYLFLYRHRLRVVEVAVEMRYRQGGRSTLTPRRAAIALARTALAMVVDPLRRPVATSGRNA